MASATGTRAAPHHRPTAGQSPTSACCCCRSPGFGLLFMGIIVVVCSADTARAQVTETVCGSIDIRNNAKNMHKLENCTIIEGYLRINLIDKGVPEDYENMSFPKLREVTGYVLLHRASGMRSFGKLFPNLAVIRGDTLFATYALVIYQMYQLQEVGLTNLMDIVSGSVLIKDNPSLCYMDTIDWDRIARSGKTDNLIINNKRSDECPNTCPENCPIKTKLDEKVSLCWNSHSCQKVCPKECAQNNLACIGNTCCPQQCLGGCTAPNASNCFACRNVTLGGRCLEKCPGSFYRYMGRRCISEDECKAKSSLSRKYKPFDKECLDSCPSGFMEGKNPHTCIRCEGRCPKFCKGSVIASVGDARKFRGCTYIQGMLEIQIFSGTGDIQNELESSLGSIEEIKNYLKVVRSFPLTSLDFLRNLSIIHGEILHPGNYSLVVLDNENLESLWHWDKRPSSHMQIKRGKVQFHLNPQLCLNKIIELKTRANAPPWDNIDVSQTTNGNRASCVMSTFNLAVSMKSSTAVIVQWENYKFRLTDQRVLLGYAIYYREAKTRNVPKHEGYTACVNDVWKVQEVSVGDNYLQYAFIPDLKPSTQYAVYVRAYIVPSEIPGAESEIEYFMTKATECPKECEQNNLACVGNTCCHPQCLGGCTAPNASSCFACRNVTLRGRCLEKCPGSFYRYMGTCISEDECKAKSSLSRKYKPFNKECLDSCPLGYMEGKNPHTCIKCEGRCPKVCKGSVIASVGDARKFKGCTNIQGMLEIQILRGTCDLQKELESSLGSIEEITNYLKVVRSCPLTSLDFLRNLTIIHGEILHPGNYSLVVLDNQNLESLWHWDKRRSSHMQIKRGKVHFHLNPKLCLSKINELKTRANAPPWDNIDVSQTTNGDRASCVMSTFSLTVSRKSSTAVIIQWENYKFRLTDQRVLLGYAIYYREAKTRDVSKHEGYTACGSDVWKVQEVSVGDNYVQYAFIPHLKPSTQYAVYVRAYMVSSKIQGAESEIEYLMTNAKGEEDMVPTTEDELLANQLMARLSITLKSLVNFINSFLFSNEISTFR